MHFVPNKMKYNEDDKTVKLNYQSTINVSLIQTSTSRVHVIQCLLLTDKDAQSTQSNDFVNNEIKYKTVILDTIICTWTFVYKQYTCTYMLQLFTKYKKQSLCDDMYKYMYT